MLRSISILSLSLIGESGVGINLRLIGESGVSINLRLMGILSLIGESGVWINLRLIGESGVWINLRLIGESGVWINLRLIGESGVWIGESGVWIGESGAAKVLLGLSITRLIFGLISGKPKVRLWPRLLIHKVLIGTRGRKLVLTGHVLAYHLDLLLNTFGSLMIACP
jgi:hypothetical protein